MSGFGLRSMGREVAWIGAGQGLAALGAFAGMRLLTTWIPPAVYGQVALAVTVATLVQQALYGPAGMASLRFFHSSRESDDLETYLAATWSLCAGATVISCAAGLVAVAALALAGYAELAALGLAALALAVTLGYGSTVDGMQSAARQRTVGAWHQALGQWLRPAAAVGAVILAGPSALAAVCGYVVASLAVLVSQWVFLRRLVQRSRMAPTAPAAPDVTRAAVSTATRAMLSYGWPFTAWGAVAWAQLSSDRWALQWAGDLSDVGRYAVLYQVGYYPMSMLASVLLHLAGPIVFELAGDTRSGERVTRAMDAVRKVVLALMAASVCGAVAALVAHAQVFSLVVAPEYGSVSHALPALTLAGGLFAAGQAAALRIQIGKNTTRLIAPKVISSLAGVLFNVTAAFSWGVEGVAWAQVLFGVVHLAAIWLAGGRRPASATS